MEAIKHYKGERTTDMDYHANVPAIYAPRITGTKTVQGETFYTDKEGKLYRPHLYDAMFRVSRGIVRHYTYKGLNPCVRLRD